MGFFLYKEVPLESIKEIVCTAETKNEEQEAQKQLEACCDDLKYFLQSAKGAQMLINACYSVAKTDDFCKEHSVLKDGWAVGNLVCDSLGITMNMLLAIAKKEQEPLKFTRDNELKLNQMQMGFDLSALADLILGDEIPNNEYIGKNGRLTRKVREKKIHEIGLSKNKKYAIRIHNNLGQIGHGTFGIEWSNEKSTFVFIGAEHLGRVKIMPGDFLLEWKDDLNKPKENKEIIKVDDFPSDFMPIVKFLKKDFTHFEKKEVRSKAFGIVALQHMADGLSNLTKKEPDLKHQCSILINKIVEIALHKNVCPFPPEWKKNPQYFGDHGIYLSNLNQILGQYKNITGNNAYKHLNIKISKYLAMQTLHSKGFHIKPYPNFKLNIRWTSDQALTLKSLYLCDKNYSTNFSKLPIRKWTNYLRKNLIDKKYDLPITNALGNRSSLPRGSNIAALIIHSSEFAPDLSKYLYQNFEKHYYNNYIFAGGFREWPNGIEKQPDLYSGPIVRGIGASSTALGRGAAAIHNDIIAFNQINASITVGETVYDKSLTSNLIANSINAHMTSLNY